MDIFNLHRGTSPLFVSLPHDGTALPDDIAARMTPAARRVPDTDWHVSRLYAFARELVEGVLHPAGVDRARRRPLLDRDLQHLLAAEGADAPRHARPVDELAAEQQLGHEHGELLAGQVGVSAHRFFFAPLAIASSTMPLSREPLGQPS